MSKISMRFDTALFRIGEFESGAPVQIRSAFGWFVPELSVRSCRSLSPVKLHFEYSFFGDQTELDNQVSQFLAIEPKLEILA